MSSSASTARKSEAPPSCRSRWATCVRAKPPAFAYGARAAQGAEQPRLGVAVRPLTPAEGSETGVKGGLVVEQSTGPAAAAGIAPGDVILSVNGTPVKSVDELRAAIEKAGKHAALLVQRDAPGGRTQIFVPVELG